MGVKGSDYPIKCCCFSSWRHCCFLTMASALVSLGVVITVQGLRESLSDEYVSLLGVNGIGQMWVLGPILLMCGLAAAIASCFIPSNNELQKNDGDYDYAVDNGEVPPEEDAVPMEPLIFLM